MAKTISWAEIAALYLALLDSNIETAKPTAKEPQRVTFQWKYNARIKYEIRKVICNGKSYEVRNGFIIYDN